MENLQRLGLQVGLALEQDSIKFELGSVVPHVLNNQPPQIIPPNNNFNNKPNLPNLPNNMPGGNNTMNMNSNNPMGGNNNMNNMQNNNFQGAGNGMQNNMMGNMVEEDLDYWTFSCSKQAKPDWKPYWDFPLKQGQREDVKCICHEGMSILDFLFPLRTAKD